MTPSLYERWLVACAEAIDEPDAFATRPCPSCSSPSLNLAFVVMSRDETMGIPCFWCDACLQGTFVCRALIPEGARRVPKNQRDTMPNYRVVS